MRARFTSFFLASVRWLASGLAGKTSWEWLELIIVPLFLAIGAFYLDIQSESRQERIAAERYKQETEMAAKREQRAVLNGYFEQMKELLLVGKLRESAEDSEVRSVARGMTATTIKALDSDHNTLLISFFQESQIIQDKGRSIPLLNNLDLKGASLREADLGGAFLRETKLNDSDLSDALLSGADLSEANLASANLSNANLSYADLTGANLIGANLEKADLSNSNLSETQIQKSILCNTILPVGFSTDPKRDCTRPN